MPLFKILKDGNACSGGSFRYIDKTANFPTEWTPEVKVEMCDSGYHLTTNPWTWYKKGTDVYDAEGRGQADYKEDKVVFPSVRLLRVNGYYSNIFARLDVLPSFFQEAKVKIPNVIVLGNDQKLPKGHAKTLGSLTSGWSEEVYHELRMTGAYYKSFDDSINHFLLNFIRNIAVCDAAKLQAMSYVRGLCEYTAYGNLSPRTKIDIKGWSEAFDTFYVTFYEEE